MSDSPTSILARQHETLYRNHSQHAEFGASDHLYALQRAAVNCSKAELGERKLIARVLADAFGRLAQQADGMPVSADAAREAHATLDQPIRGCLVLLAGSVPGLTAVAVLVKLVTAMEQVKLA